MEDLDKAICMYRKAVQATPDDYPIPLRDSSNLGVLLAKRYELRGQIEDLEEAIQVCRKAVQVTPQDHFFFATGLSNLGNMFRSRYNRTGNICDLEKAVLVCQEAVRATLSNLGNLLSNRYNRTGQICDLEEAVLFSRKAIRATPDGHDSLEGRLNNLGVRLANRYERTGQMEDLEEMIQLSRQAVQGTRDDHPDFTGWLSNLGIRLARRYERKGSTEDLEEAIQVSRQAVERTPNGHPNLIGYSSNLGAVLTSRFNLRGQIDDLEEAIHLSRQAVQATRDDHPDFAGWLSNLGMRLASRYEHRRNTEDLNEAIQVSHQAVQATPEDHPSLTGRLSILGNALAIRYDGVGHEEDLEEAIQVFHQAVNVMSAPPLNRIKAATLAINLLVKRKDYDSGYTLVVEAIDLLRLVHNRYLTLQDQQYVVSHFSGLATQACSLALQTGQRLFKALQLLETGRGVILSLLMDDRSDTSELRKTHPALCALYECLRLEVNTPTDSTMSPMGEPISPRRPKALEELEKCIQDIRQLPGFGSFQQGLTVEQMMSASNEGSIIVVNITSLRSDAIIISSEELKLVSIPQFSAVQAQIWVDQGSTGMGNKSYRLFLSWLWRECVDPILNELGYCVHSSPEDLPRVWWIGTGVASSFPFHAACDMSVGLTESTFSRVISSHTPTIKALLHARERGPLSTSSSERLPKLLMVTMASTPDANNLPGVERERSAVEELLGATTRIEVLDHPDSASVICGIRECQIAHFACHGISNAFDPSQSGLLLQTPTPNPRQDTLSVLKLCENRPTQGEIAYLSACSTAENRAQHLVDEVLHIVSGFQIAGFRHVIGTLWPSDDNVCVEIAKLFYAELCQNGTLFYTDRSIAMALHKAAVLVSTSEDYRKRPLHWAQYVHYGA
ncbi:hypothetical protein N7471_012706 [Penicillium samsonianum]|uniref:uncharacterized protein n=1 Tax=Penicillium samsonianum TaxID=1882272 RepID=UPI0025498E67|nr:uncharacterized protein N7471_012706 [Penicillium samsonianum]KAJ6125389.1 hypothetical protein N7471_012706 [Penicillium samsonianum]